MDRWAAVPSRRSVAVGPSAWEAAVIHPAGASWVLTRLQGWQETGSHGSARGSHVSWERAGEENAPDPSSTARNQTYLV